MQNRNNIIADQKLQAVIKAARTILRKQTFSDSARLIFEYCREVTEAESGYIALLSNDGKENEILFLEAEGMPCVVNPDLRMPVRGLSSLAYTTHRTIYENDFMNSEWYTFITNAHTRLRNVMLSPLNISGKTVGLIGLANKPADFTDDDAEIVTVFGELAALAFQNSRQEDILKEKTVLLELALSRIQLLNGVSLKCSKCKKAHSDEEFWSNFENYLIKNKNTKLKNALCPDCLEEFYPDYYDKIISSNKKY